ncbi:MAG: SDR family NAD(P)-dependent oxidoreductase [Hyphomicrobiaceae bacterium]
MNNTTPIEPPPPWSTVWITGASGGLGREIARRLAQRGCSVAVSARSAEKLDDLCATSARLHAFPLDVRDKEKSAAVVNQIVKTLGVPDLVILNAGIGKFKKATRFDADAFRTAFETNVIGMGNALEAIIPAMVARGSGHIALMGSLAGYRGFPRAAHYAPTKAAVRSLAECLYLDLEDKGIEVTVINPGYVETELTDGLDVPMPGLMALAPAVDRIIRGLEKEKYEIAFPFPMAMLVKLGVRVSNYSYFFATRWTMGLATEHRHPETGETKR